MRVSVSSDWFEQPLLLLLVVQHGQPLVNPAVNANLVIQRRGLDVLDHLRVQLDAHRRDEERGGDLLPFEHPQDPGKPVHRAVLAARDHLVVEVARRERGGGVVDVEREADRHPARRRARTWASGAGRRRRGTSAGGARRATASCPGNGSGRGASAAGAGGAAGCATAAQAEGGRQNRTQAARVIVRVMGASAESPGTSCLRSKVDAGASGWRIARVR